MPFLILHNYTEQCQHHHQQHHHHLIPPKQRYLSGAVLVCVCSIMQQQPPPAQQQEQQPFSNAPRAAAAFTLRLETCTKNLLDNYGSILQAAKVSS